MPNTYFCAYSVQIGDRHSRLQYLPRRFANLVVGIEQQLFLLTRITHDKCASQICAVAFELRGQVYDDEVPRLNRCPVNFPVNPGAAKPRVYIDRRARSVSSRFQGCHSRRHFRHFNPGLQPTKHAFINLAESRWPDGYACPRCDYLEAYELSSRPVYKCKKCNYQVSVTAGTVLHGTRLPLRDWFSAAYLVATHTPGISAVQLQRQLGLKRYETAWGLLQKLRRAMVRPERDRISGEVEVDETYIGGLEEGRGAGRLRDSSHRGQIIDDAEPDSTRAATANLNGPDDDRL